MNTEEKAPPLENGEAKTVDAGASVHGGVRVGWEVFTAEARMTPAERDASYLRFVARQAGHHLVLRALLATHPDRAAVQAVLRAEASKQQRQAEEKLPPALQERMNEEIVSWLALLA